ncbi:MAG: zinc ABC transporter substrate-binding protein, partial [Pseudomonadota bacterium]
YKAEILSVIGPLRDQIQAVPEADRWLVTSEGAFSYLARDLGLSELYIWPINADQQGTPSQVRAVIDTVRENNIPVVFSESTISPEPAQQIARETGARYGGALYVDSLSEADGPVPTYLDLLRETTSIIATGLTK